MALFATSAWADAAYGFENNATSESGYPTSNGDGSRSISSSISRTGSYSLEQNNNNTSDKVVKLQNVSATFKGGKHYIHSIAYIRKNTSNNATLKGYSFYAGSEFGSQTASSALSSDWTRVVNKAQRTGNTQDYTSVELRYKTNTATKGDKVYLDDIIVYVTEGNDKTDLKKPGSATEPEATAVEISWTNGEDQSDSNNGATGIQNTLIWKRTSGSENDLTLNDQGVYSLTAKEGPSTDQSGHWTLVTASVAAGTAGETSSYSGTFTPNDVYAIVHRDLAYNYSTPTYVLIPAAGDFTVTYKAGAGTGTDVVVEHAITVADCPNTFTYEGFDFTGWKDSGNNDVAVGSLVSADMTLTAQWVAHQASTDATLNALSITGCTLNEPFAPATTAYTANLPFYASMPKTSDVTATKNDEHAADPEVSITGNVITIHCVAEDGKTEKDYTVTITIAPAPTASTSINIEQLVLDYGKSYKIEDALTAANIVTDGRNGLDSIDESKPYRNYAFWGLKLKKNDADILKVIVPAGKVLNIKIGSIGAAVNVLINNEAYTTIAADKNKINHFFHLDATENPREVIFHTTANETTTLQQVKIGEECDDFTLPALYTVTYNAGAGTCTKASDFIEFADETVTLPAATPATGYAFDGWFTAASEGTLVGAADAKVALTKDSTLYAQYSLVDYDVTYTAPTNGSYTIKVGDASAVNESTTANYEQVVTLAVASTEEGYRFNGWTVSKAEGTVPVTNNQFTMPAEAVTVSAAFVAVYTISFANGGGSGDAPEAIDPKAEGETFEVPANTFTAPEGKTFDKWNDGTNDYAPGATYTVGTANVTLTAQWKDNGGGTGFDNTADEIKAVKFVENGQLFIRRGEKVYTITGELVK